MTEGFARQGARVAFIDIAVAPSLALVDDVEASTGLRPLYLEADLRDIEALRAAVRQAAEAHGPVTVLINNAAFDQRHSIEEVDVDYWDNNQAINLQAAFLHRAGGGAGHEAGGPRLDHQFHLDLLSHQSPRHAVLHRRQGRASSG